MLRSDCNDQALSWKKAALQWTVSIHIRLRFPRYAGPTSERWIFLVESPASSFAHRPHDDHALTAGVSSIIFSLEMDCKQIRHRIEICQL
ncbi:uncharacterized protein SEPMUDRAFT_148876 [Sphaerulina musiva SO2202]|uniref:Uncharacterized protein n=1 Tax=Sphaerulina musiva (strain SO2202) TaxID=692275 RepID=M3D6Y9_SPHMS|nr:uncharacterized protein SEPMUDRAFT_148876 [Sphaerulina musiva SO2202]EMF13644.1 hypothetical protein SEPMUDRAFT_148876 [Sphaerulina musiva SO2202]